MIGGMATGATIGLSLGPVGVALGGLVGAGLGGIITTVDGSRILVGLMKVLKPVDKPEKPQ